MDTLHSTISVKESELVFKFKVLAHYHTQWGRGDMSKDAKVMMRRHARQIYLELKKSAKSSQTMRSLINSLVREFDVSRVLDEVSDRST